MKKRDFLNQIMIILVILAIVLSLGFALMLVRQEAERRRSEIEYQVYQIMTGLVDVYTSGGVIDPSFWPELSGFGIYSNTGRSLYRYGTAPVMLSNVDAISSQGKTVLSGSSMTIIRQSGPVSMRRGKGMEGDGRGMIQMMGPLSGGPGRMRNLLTVPEFENRFVFIDTNVENLLKESRYAFLAVVALLLVFVAIVMLLIVFSRKIATYREREQKTSHLVQLGEAARTLAHEIKNPLGVIRVQCATLMRTVSEERRKNIEIIEEETNRLVDLTDRVRDFLNNSDGNPQIQEASYFLEQCALRYTGTLQVVPWALPSVFVRIDANRMMQVLDNLIINAQEASMSMEKDAPFPELSMTVSHKQVTFIVADRGSGVDIDSRSRLFEPFFTTKSKGTGIGLALARRFISQAGGTILYENRAGGGSVFSVVLPVTAEGEKKNE